MIVYLANKTQFWEDLFSNRIEEISHCNPQEIMDEIAALNAEIAAVLESIRQLL